MLCFPAQCSSPLALPAFSNGGVSFQYLHHRDGKLCLCSETHVSNSKAKELVNVRVKRVPKARCCTEG